MGPMAPPGPGRSWVPQGARIGWVVGNDVLLDPAVSHQLAQQTAGAERLSISMSALRRQLRGHGLLASVDEARHMLVVRRVLESSSRKVLHLRAADLVS